MSSMVTTKEIVTRIDQGLDGLTARPEAMVGSIAAAEQAIITLLEMRAFALESDVQPMVEHRYFTKLAVGLKPWQTIADGLPKADAKAELVKFVCAVRRLMDMP